MTNEQLLDDLKQFITTSVSQATAGLATQESVDKLASKADLARVEGKLDDLNLKVDTIADSQAESIDDHEKRLTRLEQAAA